MPRLPQPRPLLLLLGTIFGLGALAPGSAAAEKLDLLLFDHDVAMRFARSMGRSILMIEVTPMAEPWTDQASVRPVDAMAAAVRDHRNALRLVTAGPVCQAAQRVRVRTPSGRLVASSHHVLGDGAACELVLSDFFAQAELVGLPMDTDMKETRVSRPVFSVGSPASPLPVLAKATVVEVLRDELAGFFVTDFRFPHGTPLVTPERKLLGLCYRVHPKHTRLTVAVSAEKLDAWLRTEGPPVPRGSRTPFER